MRRIAESQVNKAITEIDNSDFGISDTVHKIRKRCKKLRGLIRLVRPCFGDYAVENVAIRDAAAKLSFIRDAEAILETHDALMDFYADQIDTSAYLTIRCRLVERKEEVARASGLEEKLARFRNAMTETSGRIGQWDIDEKGFAAVAGGLGKTYKRARKALAAAANRPTAESVHELRKRVKYHWYHARLLKDIWPKIMKPHVGATKALADLLGAHHDLAVLQRTVAELDRDQRKFETYVGLAEGRQVLLEAQTFGFGRKLLAEKPSALKRRWGIYWEAWQAEEEALSLARAA